MNYLTVATQLLTLTTSLVTLVVAILQINKVRLEIMKQQQEQRAEKAIDTTLHIIVERRGDYSKPESWNGSVPFHAFPFTILHGWPSYLARFKLQVPYTVAASTLGRLRFWSSILTVGGIALVLALSLPLLYFLRKTGLVEDPGLTLFGGTIVVVSVALLLSPIMSFFLNLSLSREEE